MRPRSLPAPTDERQSPAVRSPSTTSISTQRQTRETSPASTRPSSYPGPRVLIQVRDFAFDKTDERFRGAGALVPKANHLGLLVRRLVGAGTSDEEDEEVDDDGDDDEDGGELSPGLYRAVCAFEAEGAGEMGLTEGQIVRVVGRGVGVGWAVAVGESGGLALVPESYLEAWNGT
ncbi:hypothetical protein C0992_011579 [Termitomyces sp. T32_za158]|nr:hypothetical protein C0992_011579 [Termitomyces sp. T32_za158]